MSNLLYVKHTVCQIYCMSNVCQIYCMPNLLYVKSTYVMLSDCHMIVDKLYCNLRKLSASSILVSVDFRDVTVIMK